MSSPAEEWYIDASTSRPLRIISHLPSAGIGGVLLLLLGMVAIFVATNPGVLLSWPALVIAMLLLIGGPYSLAYLWPMLTDPDQRPSTSEFAGAAGFPFTLKSVSTAAVSGALGISVLLAVGVPGTVIYWLVVACVFSPILVAVVTTHGRLEDGILTINRTDVPLHRITSIRSVRIGRTVVVWLSYVRRSGLFLPRFAVVPVHRSNAVMSTIEAGIEADPDLEPPDRAVQAVVFGTGVLLLGVAGLAAVTVTEPSVRTYAAVGFGGLGGVLCFFGIRGV